MIDLKDTIEKAYQVLDEERAAPTVNYGAAIDPTNNSVTNATNLVGAMYLGSMRTVHPRQVTEDPTMFRFQSVNYNLLCAIFSQVPTDSRPSFIRDLSLRLKSERSCARNRTNEFPRWDGFASESPLIAEFLVRNGGKDELFAILVDKTPRFIPGHALLLLQLEEMIALNYSIFTDGEYSQLSEAIKSFAGNAKALLQDYLNRNIFDVQYLHIGNVNGRKLCFDIIFSSDGIIEECRKARYFYLKGALLEGVNLEINQDKASVETHLQQLGFTRPLIDALNEAERLYLNQTTRFDFKNCLGHLRSFLENLQEQAMPAIHVKCGGTLRPGWGGGLAYLAQNSVLSKAEEQFAVGLFRLMSDEGVHVLIAKREYARLARNMVIEYALLFLKKVDKFGVKSVIMAG
ncbi:MAG TPA: hypothetical protein VK709_10815 [Candidatus Saccharimonadales bacterium]|nr:hypothetical protein [Candidatus Saccharimonadales bacterium]